ncbi:MAG TPA: class I SAM-dependent methyltransferase [bacterium]|nr:class I SAM-dependent methyltransferase [bacterium]
MYSAIAGIYHELFPVNTDFLDYVAASLQPGDAVLDAGCGSGDTAGMLAGRGFAVSGADADGRMIARASNTYPAVGFHALDIRNLDRLSGSFHCIYCIGNVISYLKPDEKTRLIRIVKSMLEPRGLWITQFVNWDAIVTRDHVAFQDKEIPDIGVVFKRSYPRIQPERVVFQTELIRDGESRIDTADLFPVTVADFQRMNTDIGFELKLHGRDFRGTPYDSATITGNVFVYFKP